MLEIVHDRSKTSEGLLYCDLESKWENYHIIIIPLPGQIFQKQTKIRDASSGYKTYTQVFTRIRPFFLETVASLSPVHQSPYLVPRLINLTPVHISTPTLARPILMHFLNIYIYVSQEASSFQIFSSKFCMKVPSLSCVLLSQPISCEFAATPVLVGFVTKKLIM